MSRVQTPTKISETFSVVIESEGKRIEKVQLLFTNEDNPLYVEATTTLVGPEARALFALMYEYYMGGES